MPIMHRTLPFLIKKNCCSIELSDNHFTLIVIIQIQFVSNHMNIILRLYLNSMY